MARRKAKTTSSKQVETLTHDDAKRKNIPSAEHQPVLEASEQKPIQVAYQQRNPDLDPQLIWRGKYDAGAMTEGDMVVNAPPLYIQEKVHPKVIIDDLMRLSDGPAAAGGADQLDLFGDFNGLPESADRTEFYAHDANWSNRMILGDSLQVMASLAEREGLRGQVQCIYLDPPYGIKFNSNFQWSTTSRDVKDGKADHITREPEQVKAFRDTWRDGIHSYLTYLRDRLTVARDLLHDTGSIFVQIGDENVHRVRAVMDEVFGEANGLSTIVVWKTSSQTSGALPSTCDFILWYAKKADLTKYRVQHIVKDVNDPSTSSGEYRLFWQGFGDYLTENQAAGSQQATLRRFRPSPTTSQSGGETTRFSFEYGGTTFKPGPGGWKTSRTGFNRLAKADRLMPRKKSISYVRFLDDFPVVPVSDLWTDVRWGFDASEKRYVVETNPRVVQRCLLMATDPGDLVLDPTCGSGTTAYVAEQWGRRWITIDTSRVALALARARIMGARYRYYLLADSPEGQQKEAELTRTEPSTAPTHGNIRHGFVYQRVPHITLKSIANNTEIDVIFEDYQQKLEPLRDELNKALGTSWEEWEIPRELTTENTENAEAVTLHEKWWKLRIERQKEIDASIAAKADSEYLYDKPYEDRNTVRVAGPFTVESLSPHRVLGVDENDELIDPVTVAEKHADYAPKESFPEMVLENLQRAGVQQAHKEDKIDFLALTPWPGEYVCAEGHYQESEGGAEKRAGIFIGPEFGTVTRPDLVAAAREAAESGFDVLVACAFNYEGHASDLNKLGRIPVLKARMNADLHMADDLKNTGKGNLFVIFGEPDITVASEEWLVDSAGRRIAPYDIFALVSGVDSLAKINGLDGQDLRDYVALSNDREVRDYLANATGGELDTGKHRRGTSETKHGGVSTVAWHSARVAGRTGNLRDAFREAGLPESGEFRKLVKRLRRDKQNDSRAHEIPVQPPLTTSHYAQVTVHGVDVFHPQTGEIRSDGADGIACWFVDTDYNEESFFVRQAYFLGQNDPYKSLKTTLRAEIDADAWETLHSATSRPFPKPKDGRIAVKVINHLGDEVMKVFRV